MPVDEAPFLGLRQVLVATRRRLDHEGEEDSPSYTWAYARLLSGELPGEKVGPAYRLPHEAVDILTNLWRTRRRRSSCAA
jgi:hypothetical protein